MLKMSSTSNYSLPKWPMLTGIVGLAGIVALLSLSIANEYQEYTQHAQAEVENYSRVLEEHASAIVYKSDLLLREVQRSIRTGDISPSGSENKSRTPQLRALLKSQLEGVPEIAVIHIANARGQYIYSSLEAVPDINIADREYFRRQAESSAEGLVISPPLISRTTGKWTLVLSRRINFEDGRFAGIASAILNLEYFQQFYRNLDLGSQGVVALYDRQFHLAARFPPNEALMGKVVPLGVKTYIEQGVSHGVYPSKSPVDGVMRQISFRQLADFPLFVFAGISEEDYLTTWRQHIWQYSAGALIFCLVVISLGLRQRRTEKALRQDEERFRYMLETSPIAVRIASSAGRRVLFANQRYIELIESRPNQALGVDPRDYYAQPQDYDAVLQSLAHGESVSNKLVELTIPGGTTKWALASYLHLEYGNESAVLGWFYDITERKRMELALQHSEATSRALINATSETAILLDEVGTVVAINEVGAHRLGSEQNDMVGRNFYDFLPPNIAKSRREFAAQIFRNGKAAQLHDVRNGTHFINNIFPVFDADGKVENIAVYAADVTDRLQLQGIDQLFYAINQHVLRGQSIYELFQYICTEVTKIFDYQYVWIGRKEEDGSVSIRAAAGQASEYCAELKQTAERWDDSPLGKGPSGSAIKTGQVQVIKIGDAGFGPWREAAECDRLNVIMSVPLIIRGEIFGAITLYSQHEHSFDSPEIQKRLAGIASRICIAVETAQDQQQLTLLHSALSATANGVFITDKSGRILWVNKAFTLLTGFKEADAVGLTPRFLNSGKQSPTYYENLWQTILRGDVWRKEMEELRKDGSLFFVRQTITPILDAQAEISHFIAILEDITVEKEAEARIEHMAHYDSLTQLPNRALFHDRLYQALAAARRTKTSAALLFLDLDQFKSVNDKFGHPVGDLLLQQVAARLNSCVRETDTVARLAGDEFTVILTGMTGKENASRVAQKIVDAFSVPFDLDGNEVFSSTSIGIAVFPDNAPDDQTLLKRADAAMYIAKQAGKNKFVFAD
jgi:diguanylate cyclase (GGDEF)-like protein/PAS domain S-box-containing protein